MVGFLYGSGAEILVLVTGFSAEKSQNSGVYPRRRHIKHKSETKKLTQGKERVNSKQFRKTTRFVKQSVGISSVLQ